MYSCIIFLLTEGTARILSYSHNTEMSIEVRVASKKFNEDLQILPRKSLRHLLLLFQIPQICHFVVLCAVPLGLTGVAVYELERSFLMPRESSALQRLMTSLLSTPFQRTRSARPRSPSLILSRSVTTCLENLEMSGNLKHVRETSGMLLTVREM